MWVSFRHFRGGSSLAVDARPPTFAAASFVAGTLSTVVGASGPIMNPIYLGAGIVKEEMIGTKAASTLCMQSFKIAAFLSLDLLGTDLLVAGLAVGVATFVGNTVGARLLRQISVDHLLWRPAFRLPNLDLFQEGRKTAIGQHTPQRDSKRIRQAPN